MHQLLVYQLTNFHGFDRSEPLYLIRFAQYRFFDNRLFFRAIQNRCLVRLLVSWG